MKQNHNQGKCGSCVLVSLDYLGWSLKRFLNSLWKNDQPTSPLWTAPPPFIRGSKNKFLEVLTYKKPQKTKGIAKGFLNK